MLKALKKIFGKADGTQPQSGSSPVPQGPAGATAKGTAPTGEKPTEKRPRKPRPPRADNESGAPRAAEKAEKGEKPAKPAAKEGRDAKPRSDKPRRERKPKPVDNWKLEDFVVEPQEGKTRFHDFNLAPSLMHAIHDLGFPYCTPIQAQVLGFTLR
ncbi:ATP-dependent RNA helicase RhlB, partial [Pseudomonas aeruginosa]